ncbi:MAG: GGDEF domain-containing protein, partial [Alphaproteobacteria bacterium]|nr:GGDEF domain-containing protein [Alphaproteobacteria bacterium]
MSHLMQHIAVADNVDDLTDKIASREMDLRMVLALAGERDLNAREQVVIDKLKEERGESLFSDMLYALTHKTFPSRQARTIWGDITSHRKDMLEQLGRDPGVMVATHDYLTNRSGLLKQVSLIEESKLASLAEVAIHDGLTGLIEKRTFSRRLKEELERLNRYGGKLALVLLDIDHFKKLNDTFGHADGDIVLTQVAEIIGEQARTTDIAARYGGEEFAVLLVGVGEKSGTIFAERLRQAIEQRFLDTDYKTTVSIGVATNIGDNEITAEDFVRQADAQLYLAKE